MTIKWEFSHTNQDGSPAMTLIEWVSTLSELEQAEFNEARTRQSNFAQQLIDSGVLVIGQYDEFLWSVDPVTVDKQFDPIWSQYRTRYIEENNIRFEINQTEV